MDHVRGEFTRARGVEWLTYSIGLGYRLNGTDWSDSCGPDGLEGSSGSARSGEEGTLSVADGECS